MFVFDYDIFLCALEVWALLICLMASVFSYFSAKTGKNGSRQMFYLQICCSILMAGDLFAFFYGGGEGSRTYFFVSAGNFINFFMPYLCSIAFCNYMRCFLNPDKQTDVVAYSVGTLSLGGMLLAVLNLFFHFSYSIDANNLYHREDYFDLTVLYGILPFLGILYVIQHNRRELGRRRSIALLSYVILPAVFAFTQVCKGYTKIARLNIGFAISIVFMTVVLFLEQRADIYRQREDLLVRKEELLAQEKTINDMQIRLVISQIQPHFLYNALNAIYYLCEKNVQDAQDAIIHFSTYLRGNMDALRATEPVPFSVELNHVKSYLALEKMRFEDELEIIFDIETEDFMIPALSLQPIVENAVKHGVGKKPEGGTVTIRVVQMQDSIEIIVSDDGVGFDINEKKEDGCSHVGMENVRRRLNELVDGTLKVRSKPGEGTVAVLAVPKNKGFEKK